MRARILIVEDEPQLRGLLRLYLERAGYAVTDAGDGESALAAFAADGAELVVLDPMRPGMQGEAVLEALREHGDVPILITSAKRTDAERIAGLRMGADDYPAKPVNPQEPTARRAGAPVRPPRQAGQPAGAARPGGGHPAARSAEPADCGGDRLPQRRASCPGA